MIYFERREKAVIWAIKMEHPASQQNCGAVYLAKEIKERNDEKSYS